MIDYTLIFTTGLLTSFHCLGMCGTIVLAYSIQPAVAGNRWSGALPLHVAYNGGRIAAYALIGAVVGSIGMGAARVQNIGEIIAVVGGSLMVFAGLSLIGVIPVSSFVSIPGGSGFMMRMRGALLRRRTAGSTLALGLLTPLLPCGMLYAMVIRAASTGNVLEGSVTMALFAAGMTPALALLGSVSSLLTARVRQGAEKVAAVIIMLMGVALILRGFHVPYLAWMAGTTACPNCAH